MCVWVCDTEKNLKQKYLLKYGRQENLMICFFNYAMICTNKTQKEMDEKLHPPLPKEN